MLLLLLLPVTRYGICELDFVGPDLMECPGKCKKYQVASPTPVIKSTAESRCFFFFFLAQAALYTAFLCASCTLRVDAGGPAGCLEVNSKKKQVVFCCWMLNRCMCVTTLYQARNRSGHLVPTLAHPISTNRGYVLPQAMPKYIDDSAGTVGFSMCVGDGMGCEHPNHARVDGYSVNNYATHVRARVPVICNATENFQKKKLEKKKDVNALSSSARIYLYAQTPTHRESVAHT
ncbi:hypothetical protein F4823DRAFT_58575 [Ustulina deusta]|nr:hypothetical protein F4823DRAFT_58575 [Ustulina deusta]